MKLLAKLVWTTGVLAGLSMGAHTLIAAPAAPAQDDCYACYYAGGGLWYCYAIGCDDDV